MRRTLVLSVGLLLLPWALPTATATITAGAVDALISPEQNVREKSSAVPVFGFAATSDGSDALDQVWVYFGGSYLYPYDNYTYRTLNVSSGYSGVGLYRDDGVIDDQLDASDTPVMLDDIYWTGNYIFMDLTGHNEPLPAATTGNYSWFVVVRTSDSTSYWRDGWGYYARIYANNIVVTDGLTTASLPASTVTTNTYYAAHTRGVRMTSGTTYIGQPTVDVHEVAPLGLEIVDGSSSATGGVNDRLVGLDLRITQNGGAVSSMDFAPFVANSAQSGLGFYLDDGSDDDVWDATDSPIALGSISPTSFGVGGIDIHMTFNPAVVLPATTTGAFDFFFVVRSAAIVTGDYFSLMVVPGSVVVNGVLPVDHGLMGLSYSLASYQVRGDDTPPDIYDFYWSSVSSPYIAVVDDTHLYFNREMATAVCATANVYAYDGQSGLRDATFSNEASLGGPFAPMVNITGSWNTASTWYEFTSASNDGQSPLDVVVTDQVGNSITAMTDDTTWDMTYMFEPEWILFHPDTEWCDWWNGGTYVDDEGTFWFSDRIWSTSYGELCLGVISLYGGGVKNISIASEPEIMLPDPPQSTWGPGYQTVWWSPSVGFFSNSSDGDGHITVTAQDHDGNSLTKEFPIAEDNTPPQILIESPSNNDILTGLERLMAQVTDSGSGVSEVWFEQRPNWYDYSMYNPGGDDYFYDMVTASFDDGPNRIIVFAEDNVGNIGSAWIDVVVQSSVIDATPPALGVVSPASGAFLSGTATVSVQATDLGGVDTVWVRVDEGPWQVAGSGGGPGMYNFSIDTTGLSDGAHTVTVRAVDMWGNEATSTPVPVRVDNMAPMASLSFPSGGENLQGTTVVRVFASDMVGVERVTLTFEGKTVDMAYNPASGYYEFLLDTTTLTDGEHSMQANVVDASGKSTAVGSVTYRVQNGDAVGALFDASPFLIFLLALVGLLLLFMFMRGRGGGSMGGGGGSKSTSRSGWDAGGSGGSGGSGDSGGGLFGGSKEPPKESAGEPPKGPM